MYGFFYALGKGRAVHGRRTMEEAMQYISTRDKQNRVSASAAIVNGLAEDGGLFVPESIPEISEAELEFLRDKDYCYRAAYVMQ